ncbi:MAG: winged helix-turn-helix transcriptional regulator [Candidatus Hodarchaeales archaeon]|jgi:DNA-binding HxlR family transcriptional regulator
MKSTVEDTCPIVDALKILGRKWITHIFTELSINGRMHFTDLLNELQANNVEKISAKVLSDNLSLLEENDLVQREVDSDQRPVRVFYSLTEMGGDLEIVFGALKAWATRWCENRGIDCQYFNCIHNNFPILPFDKAIELLEWKQTNTDQE